MRKQSVSRGWGDCLGLTGAGVGGLGVTLAACAGSVMGVAAAALGQSPPPACEPRWLEGFGRPGLPGSTDFVFGGGVLPLANGDVLFGGRFNTTSGLPSGVPPLVRWNGVSLQSEQLPSLALASVVSLFKKDSRIYAFGSASSRFSAPARVFRVDGELQAQIGPDLPRVGSYVVGDVLELAGGVIMVGANFESTTSAPNPQAVYRLSNGMWTPVGQGLTGSCFALEELADGSVIAAGMLKISDAPEDVYVARFDGQQWSRFDQGLIVTDRFSQFISDVHVTELGRLLASGSMRVAGSSAIIPVVEFDGSTWRQVAGARTFTAGAFSLASFADRELSVAGGFRDFSPVNSQLLARYSLERESWLTVPTELQQSLIGYPPNAAGVFKAQYDSIGRLYLAGQFAGATAGGGGTRNLLAFDGSRVDPMGFDSALIAQSSFSSENTRVIDDEFGNWYLFRSNLPMARIDLEARREFTTDSLNRVQQVLRLPSGQLFGVTFGSAADPTPQSPETHAIARFDEGRWRRQEGPVASGFRTNISATGSATLLRPDGSNLAAYTREGPTFVAGRFFPADRIVRFTDYGFEDAVSPQLSDVLDMANSPNGDLVVGGFFSRTINGERLENLAVWNGTQWQSFERFGGNVNGAVGQLASDLAGNLVVRGSFTQAGALRVAGIAIWTGNSWRELADASGGLNGPVEQMILDQQGKLLLRGSFSRAGMLDVSGMVLWDGERFEPWRGGNLRADLVLSREPSGELFVSNGLNTFQIGSQSFRGWAKFDGVNWIGQLPAGPTPPSAVSTGRLRDGTIWYTGNFESLDGVPSSRIAFYGVPRPVAIVQQPSDATVCSTSDAVFEVGTTGQGPIRHQWQIQFQGSQEWVNLSDGIASVPGGGRVRVRGAEMMRMRIEPVSRLANLPSGVHGRVRVMVRGACGEVMSEEKMLNVLPRCGAADIGGQGGAALTCGDGVLDSNDFVVFLQWFFAGDLRADFAGQGASPVIREPIGDGVLDNNDFVVFINLFFEGCGQ